MAVVINRQELSGKNKYVKDNKQASNSNIFPSSGIKNYSFYINNITDDKLEVKVLIDASIVLP
ncbi:hypothetical protein [Wolbachia endosymbiont of Zaprionus tsacasi]|uniref:hypothetical protein n=1 Tax=Wolbachia endosymbiont of Zaprionus tsacasi TaxID=2603209 RepID=UPI00293715C9|nr:hypothetical protein [Wolbachia endosymbiont of Zaprionus tsacasi]WOE63592.1 hypothetical protein R0F63_04490 [Wolbachia endosymbiont of Zaprionus tsacasi]